MIVRRLFNFLTLLSLLLLAAVVVLWVRSRWAADAALRVVECGDTTWTTGYLKSADGTLSAQWIDYALPRDTPAQPLVRHWEVRSVPLDAEDRKAQLRFMDGGFRVGPYGYGYLKGGNAQYRMAIPHWAAAAFGLVLPAAWLAKRVARRRRATRGKCAACGYDLRATPNRCPECGLVNPTGDAVAAWPDRPPASRYGRCR